MLGNSMALFKVGGTEVRLHPTFFLLLAWVGVVGWARGGPAAAGDGLVFVILLFACVVAHEFGHIFAARRYGIATRDVTILPIGGVASLERIPEKPVQEIVVALAGPAVNLAIAVVLVALLAIGGQGFDAKQLSELERAQSSLLMQLAAANLALVLFNLIPAFPMDGGRVLRAILASQVGYVRATQVAAMVGQAMAVVLGFLGLFGNPLLILIAVFIFLAASGEAGYVQARDLTRGRRAGDVMITSFSTLGPQSSVGMAADLLLRTTQHEFPVVDGGRRLRGIVTREMIVSALANAGDEASIMDIMQRDVPMVPRSTCLETLHERMQQEGTRFVAIGDEDGAFAGYLTPENIAEMVMIGTARATRQGLAARETPAE